MHIVTIYYRTNDIEMIRKIQKHFGFPRCMTVNGEWPVMVENKDWEVLRETEARGFIEIRNKTIKSMEVTELFIKRIEDYLKKEADADPMFAKKMKEQPEKTPEAVCNFILSEVSKMKQRDWDDEDINGMAKYFINEDGLKGIGK